MLARRIIPCLDVKDGQVVKGVQFMGHEVVGEIVDLAKRYRNEGADELVFYDITASVEDRAVDCEWVSRVAREIDIPFCVAGGIRTVEQAGERLKAGADKISINSPALENPDLINELVAVYGAQCIVVGVDSFEENGNYLVHQYTGDPNKTVTTHRHTFDWINEAVERGAGEIVLNCMNQDGVRKGYDIKQLVRVRQNCPVPLIASGGAGAPEHFREVFEHANVSGALAASVFHKGVIAIPDLKMELNKNGIEVRI